MFDFLIVFNRQGKFPWSLATPASRSPVTRASKWYKPYTEAERHHVVSEINRIVSARDQVNDCAFVDYNQKTLVYRRYASLYFATLVDSNENALLALNTIHSVVEGLDRYFQNVTELDLIFNFWKVIQLMDEMVLAGEMVESSKTVVLGRMAHLDKDNKDPNATKSRKKAAKTPKPPKPSQ